MNLMVIAIQSIIVVRFIMKVNMVIFYHDFNEKSRKQEKNLFDRKSLSGGIFDFS